MDFLDPKTERRSRTILLLGYGLVALAIGMTTLLLIYQAYGYGVDRQGNVTQSGILFVSSQPSGADILLNGQRYPSNTNSRVTTLASTYKLEIAKSGYRTWQRQVVVNGSDVQHFDYPFLFPTTLQTSSLGDLNADPSVALQSPDQRWLLLGQSESSGSFLQYDVRNPAKPVVTQFSLPASSFTAGDNDGAQSWSQVEWASDNRHVLLLHNYTLKGTSSREYILLDRDTPADSLNLNTTLGLSQTQTVNLFNNRVSQFYIYDSASSTLERVNASDGGVVSKLEHVLSFKPYGSDKIVYTTTQPSTGTIGANQVSVMLQDGQNTFNLRNLPAGAASYQLSIAQYAGDWYIAMAAGNDTAAYIYKNPQSQTAGADGHPAPWRRLPASNASYLTFSPGAQFLLAENGSEFVVYDLENVVQYHYRTTEAMDQPQIHASWMDGDRLVYTSAGKLVEFDYDYRNRQTLVSTNPAYTPFFSADYSYLYTLRSGVAGSDSSTKPALTSTPLTVK